MPSMKALIKQALIVMAVMAIVNRVPQIKSIVG